MKDAELVSLVSENRVIAVIRAESAELAFRASEAAAVGGIKMLEVALGTPGAFRVISDLCHRYGDRAVIGAGSVINYDQIDRAIKAGAQFISMPHANPPLVENCRHHRVPPIVGALTPTEVAHAWSMAIPLVILFPASSIGGPDYVGEMTARFTDVRLGAAGGVGPENIAEYFEAGAFAVGVGRQLFAKTDLEREDFASITERAKGLIRLAGVSAH
jgi:2-dehydro-3-deoxyphosphogluconate aldolase/(4S)-4-hydroxy-2-oxoglutarate aldolase